MGPDIVVDDIDHAGGLMATLKIMADFSAYPNGSLRSFVAGNELVIGPDPGVPGDWAEMVNAKGLGEIVDIEPTPQPLKLMPVEPIASGT